MAFVLVPAFRKASATAKAMWKTIVVCATATTIVRADAPTQLRATSIQMRCSTMARARNWTNAGCAVVPVLSWSAVATTRCPARAIVRATSKTSAVCAMALAFRREHAIAKATLKTNVEFAAATVRLAWRVVLTLRRAILTLRPWWTMGLARNSMSAAFAEDRALLIQHAIAKAR